MPADIPEARGREFVWIMGGNRHSQKKTSRQGESKGRVDVPISSISAKIASEYISDSDEP
jgi:hypothetical protein